MWKNRLRKNYDDNFEQFQSYSDMYGLSARLGYSSALDAWLANPYIQGSTNPDDFKVIQPEFDLERGHIYVSVPGGDNYFMASGQRRSLCCTVEDPCDNHNPLLKDLRIIALAEYRENQAREKYHQLQVAAEQALKEWAIIEQEATQLRRQSLIEETQVRETIRKWQ